MDNMSEDEFVIWLTEPPSLMYGGGHIMPDQWLSPTSTSTTPRLAAVPAYDLVVIGASAGGIPALQVLLSALPANFPLPILLVQHLSATLPSKLPQVLGYHTRLRTKWAEDGEVMAPGTVHVAPRDRHLLVGPDGRLALSVADRMGWWRPSVDVLFRSAAEVFGERTIAVVLSGAMWDGAKGIRAVAEAGGITIAQDEASSGHFDMPAAALDLGRADLAMSPGKIGQVLQVLVG